MVPGAGGSGEWKDYLVGRVSFWGDGNALELDRGDAYLTLNVLDATELSTLKWFMLCESPLNQKKSL